MAHKNRVLLTKGSLQIVESVNEKRKKKYLLKSSSWDWSDNAELTSICDPVGNRKVSGNMWKFNTLAEAKECMSLAVLKGLS